jgi:di/tricarboxylate transporter
MQQDASVAAQHDPAEPELVELLSRLFADAEQLLLQELVLVRAEVGRSLGRVLGGTLLLFAGVLTVFSGGLALTAAVILELSRLVPPGVACALVGGLVTGAGLALVLYGWRLVARAAVVPRRTLRSLREVGELAREELT